MSQADEKGSLGGRAGRARLGNEMSTVYDFLTVAMFAILVGYFLFLTDRRPQLLMHFLVSAVVFAVADQVGDFASKTGNVGMHALAVVLVVAGVAYAGVVARG
jgi:hypothetical protein